MKRTTSLLALMALCVGLLGSAPAHAAVVGTVTFACVGGPCTGVIVIGGDDGAEFHSAVIPAVEGLPLVTGGTCGGGTINLSFDSWHGQAGVPPTVPLGSGSVSLTYNTTTGVIDLAGGTVNGGHGTVGVTAVGVAELAAVDLCVGGTAVLVAAP